MQTRLSDNFDALCKVAIVGDSSVGKTNILLRYVSTNYVMSHIATIGIDFKVKAVQLDNFKLKMQIWDTAGQQRYRHLTSSIYQGAQAIVIVYSITDRKTFNSVAAWLQDIKNHSEPNLILTLLANKTDLETQRQVSKEQGKALANRIGASFYETSAATNNGIQQAFLQIAKKLKANAIQTQKSTPKSQTLKPIKIDQTPSKPISKKNCDC